MPVFRSGLSIQYQIAHLAYVHRKKTTTMKAETVICIQAEQGNTEIPGEQAAARYQFDSGIGQQKASIAFSQWTEEVMLGMKLMHDDLEFLDCITAKALSQHQPNK
jgi:hypothetical protein